MSDKAKIDGSKLKLAGTSSAQVNVPSRRAWREPAYYILAAALGLIVFLWTLPLAAAVKYTEEGQFIENISPVILGIAGLIAAIQFVRNPRSCWLAVVVLIVWTVLRELDFQRQFTPRSVESTGFYFSSKIPLQMKLITLLVLAPFIVAGVHLLKLLYKNRSELVRNRPRWARHLAIGIACAVVAVLSEKLELDRAHIIEEVLELAFACFVVVAVWEARPLWGRPLLEVTPTNNLEEANHLEPVVSSRQVT